MHIEGRRWFESTNGNPYHSVRIFDDGECIAHVPFAYGYGDQYIETALQWLEDNGHIERETWASGNKKTGTRYLRENLNASYSVIDVTRKKDL